MPLEFSEAGYLEVYRDGVFVSRHRQEREAVESILADAETHPAGSYEIRRPVIRVRGRRTVGMINGAPLWP